ncbi:hypothetical protein Vafri_15281 [Volvox africanus]|uniref:Pherophorin domain-containing protein n=1 Tax=Volvox africanus TaxID=51714 RepID=A0A8J4BKX8_9CHLO|nr:hypothetical protein Vafri_15281 [Volvox africanus]
MKRYLFSLFSLVIFYVPLHISRATEFAVCMFSLGLKFRSPAPKLPHRGLFELSGQIICACLQEVRRWHIPHRMSVVQITDPCHPVYNNDIMLRNCETKQRMLVFTEDLDANTPLSAYFGTIKTQAESDEYVLADMTHGRQLMEAYTHTCEWTELHENDSEKLVMVGDTSSCIMTYANEIRFWGSCDEQWRDVSLVAEDIRRTGCRCDGYKGRTANAECVQILLLPGAPIHVPAPIGPPTGL